MWAPPDKKRSSLPSSSQFASATSTSSHNYGRQPISRSYSPIQREELRRTDSPPASAYFSSFVHEGHGINGQPVPSADAESHFAYSTTLRRHVGDAPSLFSPAIAYGYNSGQMSFVSRAMRAFGISSENERAIRSRAAENEERKPIEDTPAAKFAGLSIDETLRHFPTHPKDGIPVHMISSLRAQYGYNEFSVPPSESLLLKFAQTIYESPLIMLLLGSAAVSAVMGNIDDAVSIGVAILIVLTVGFVQERRSEKSLEALNKLVPHHCHLIREGKESTVLANELLPGDLVKFSVGDRIPADVRLLSAIELEIDESSLTGETRAVRKDIAETQSGMGGAVPLGERHCMAFMGTLVRNGFGSGVVVATGTRTEFGVVFTMMQEVEEKRTPLQHSMDELAKKLSILSFGVIGVICLIGVLQSRSWLEMFTIGVSLAVAAIPEGLPIVTTVTLALGVLRMARRKAIVKKLPSVEALGSVSVVCSDKTGTLTKNEQTVVQAYVVDEVLNLDPTQGPVSAPPAALLKTLQIGGICNKARRGEDGNVGQATDVALLNVLSIHELGDQRQDFKVITERPFSSEKKFMAVSGIHSSYGSDNREYYYLKGSIEAVLARCRFYYVSDESTPSLDANTRAIILNRADSIASHGLRVVAMAYGIGGAEMHEFENDEPRQTLVFTGFQAMLDPPRPGVADAISLLHSGGVQVIMITGDAEHTALSIARQLGLRVQAGSSSCITGRDIDAMSERALQERIGSVCVFARTTPRHKMRIVEALQARGAIVAMTGDGVNDAPALKMANIGISMGKSGTDVAKEAADVILVDDNFSTILSAVEEGKSIFHNIQNFLSFQLSTAVAALSLITLSTVFHLSNPLNAMQILFINILMDGPPSQSLGVDPVDRAVMKRPPRPKDAPIITRRLLQRVLFSASMIVCGTLFVYVYALSDGGMSRHDQTMTFTSFVFLDLASALQNRGLGCGLFDNKMLVTTVSVSFIVQLSLIYVPFMQTIFQTEALAMGDLITLLLLGGVSMTLHEVRRRYERQLEAETIYSSAAEELA